MTKYKLEAEIEVDLEMDEIAENVHNPLIRVIDKSNRARAVKILQMSFRKIIEESSAVEDEYRKEEGEEEE